MINAFAVARAVGLCVVMMLTTGVSNAGPSNPWSHDILSWDEITSKKLPIDDVKPPPPFDPKEYAPYVKTGPGVIDGYLTIKTTRGPLHCGVSHPLLVPATLSTRWLEERVARITRTTQNPMSGRLFLASLPSWMHPTLDDKAINTGIVRRAYCGPDGYFRFEKLPYGYYLLIVDLQIYYTYSVPATDSFHTCGADGHDIYITFYDSREKADVGDGIFVGTDFQLQLSPEHPGNGIAPEDLGVFAHMHSFENYSTPPPLPSLDLQP